MLPDELAMKALVDGRPFAGAAFALTLPTTKNPLALFPLGPSGENGELRVVGDELDRMWQVCAGLAPMDYGALRGDLYVRVVNLEDLARFRHGYATWDAADAFPDDSLEWLDQRETALTPFAGQQLRAVVGSRGGTMRVHGSVQRA